LQVIDISDPTNCVLAGAYDTGGIASGVAVAEGRIYVADGQQGLLVLPTLPNVQSTVRVDAQPGVPFTIEAATDLGTPALGNPSSQRTSPPCPSTTWTST
jgi:hypothetical protein